VVVVGRGRVVRVGLVRCAAFYPPPPYDCRARFRTRSSSLLAK
jgi:hypothetical protein